MSWAGYRAAWSIVSGPAFDVYVGTRMLAVEFGSGSRRLVAAAASEGLSHVLREIPASRLRSRPVRVWLSGGLCRAFLLAAPRGLSDHAELERIASAVADARTGLSAPCRVWVDETADAGRHVVAAASEDMLAGVMSAMGDARLNVIRLAPWWGAAQHALAPPTTAGSCTLMSIADCDSLTVFSAEGGSFGSVASWPHMLNERDVHGLLKRAEAELPGVPSRSIHARLMIDGAPFVSTGPTFAFSDRTRIT